MDHNLTTIILAAIAALAAGAALTIKLTKNKNKNNQNSGRITQVNQKDIRAGGDVAGGDIIKK